MRLTRLAFHLLDSEPCPVEQVVPPAQQELLFEPSQSLILDSRFDNGRVQRKDRAFPPIGWPLGVSGVSGHLVSGPDTNCPLGKRFMVRLSPEQPRGQRIIVVDLVHGVPISKCSDLSKLTIWQRVRLLHRISSGATPATRQTQSIILRYGDGTVRTYPVGQVDRRCEPYETTSSTTDLLRTLGRFDGTRVCVPFFP